MQHNWCVRACACVCERACARKLHTLPPLSSLSRAKHAAFLLKTERQRTHVPVCNVVLREPVSHLPSQTCEVQLCWVCRSPVPRVARLALLCHLPQILQVVRACLCACVCVHVHVHVHVHVSLSLCQYVTSQPSEVEEHRLILRPVPSARPFPKKQSPCHSCNFQSRGQ